MLTEKILGAGRRRIRHGSLAGDRPNRSRAHPFIPTEFRIRVISNIAILRWPTPLDFGV
jgi:hypothetical protein